MPFVNHDELAVVHDVPFETYKVVSVVLKYRLPAGPTVGAEVYEKVPKVLREEAVGLI